MNRAVAGVILALIAALAAIGVATGEEESTSSGGGDRPASRPADVEEIARAVERVRELEFERVPRVKRVSAEEARRFGLRQVDEQLPPGLLEREERLLRLLGLLPADARIRDLVGKALATEVAAYYVPGTDTMNLIRGAGTGGFVAEVTLAHELTHALEDQRFGLEAGPATGYGRDRATAEAALHEGTATVVMVDYVVLQQAGSADLPPGVRGRVLEELEGIAVPASSGLPRYVRESLIFPYVAGARLVDRIESEGGWRPVNRAFGAEAPESTEQVMHPEKYESGERPVRVRLRGYRGALPAGARRVYAGDLGEFDTEQFLREGNGRERSERAAAGWGGGSFALWRLPGGEDALVMGWTWDSPRDAAEFEGAAMRRLADLGTPGAVVGGERIVAMALAPSAPLAERMARGAAGRP